MNETEVYAICDAESIVPGGIVPFTLARRGESGLDEPFPIVIVRDGGEQYFVYVNVCPHEQHLLYETPAKTLELSSNALICAKHGAQFETASGLCTEGPCKGASLQAIPALVIDGDVCIGGVTLIEEGEDGPPEVMITSD
jgi:nitrite reductase/ring-hydroxylating ferredoxin subunit